MCEFFNVLNFFPISQFDLATKNPFDECYQKTSNKLQAQPPGTAIKYTIHNGRYCFMLSDILVHCYNYQNERIN